MQAGWSEGEERDKTFSTSYKLQTKEALPLLLFTYMQVKQVFLLES